MRLFVYISLVFVLISGVFSNTLLSIYNIGEPLNINPARNEGMGGISLALYDKFNHTDINPSIPAQFDSTVLSVTYYRYQNDYLLEGNGSSYVNHSLPNFTFTILLPFNIPLTVSMKEKYDWGYKTIEEFDEGGISGINKGIGSGTVRNFSVGASYEIADRFAFGGRFDFWQGTPKHVWSKEFNDEDYTEVRDIISYDINGFGFSLGATYKIMDKFTIGGFYEYCGKLNVERTVSSYFEEFKKEKGNMKYPSVIGTGVGFKPFNNMTLGFDMIYSQWDKAYLMDEPDNFKNTFEYKFGLEYYFSKDINSFFLLRMPVRFGIYYKPWYDRVEVDNTLEDFREWGITFGTGYDFYQHSISGLDIAFKFSNRKSVNSNYIDENIYQIFVSFSASEKWIGRLSGD
jgi:long-subunit fatty acid transport protein